MSFDPQWQQRDAAQRLAILNLYTLLGSVTQRLMKYEAIPPSIAGLILEACDIIIRVDKATRDDETADKAKLN